MVTSNINLNISVDCVLFGYDGEALKVLLVNQTGKASNGKFHDRKLPGSLIYNHESLDDAAKRVLKELTGLDNIELHQLKAYGELDRTSNPEDTLWLKRFMQLPQQVTRIVTVAYFALIKLEPKAYQLSGRHKATWMDIQEIGPLAFDHNKIIKDAVRKLRSDVDESPHIYFELLPKKFTITQFRKLSQVILNINFDVRNFSKRVLALPYIKRLDERETNVAHRAAYLYRFDKGEYKKLRK